MKKTLAHIVTIVGTAITLMGSGVASADTVSPTGVCPYVWSKNLSVGSTGDDVRALQKFLNADVETRLTETGVGSPGRENGSFGSKTEHAVAKFQEKYRADILTPGGLTKGTGAVKAFTRAKLNTLCLTSSSTATTPVSVAQEINELIVSKPEQPKATLALTGAGGVPFTTITLTAGTADVLVKGITVERRGIAVDGVFYSIGLSDETDAGIGDERNFDSNHQIHFNGTFTVPAHSSKTITVYGNMSDPLTDYDGQMPVLAVTAIDADTQVSGSLPVLGTGQIVNTTLTIGGATGALSSFDPGIARNRYINDTGIRFSGIRITANSQEDLTLDSITWDQAGTAGSDDISNVVTMVNGTAYSTQVDGKSYTSTFSPGVIIKKGQTIDLYIQGDLKTSGVNRTVKFDIRGSDDIALKGLTYGFWVGIAAEGNTATDGESVFITSDGSSDGDEGTPFFSGSTLTIQGGTMISAGNASGQ